VRTPILQRVRAAAGLPALIAFGFFAVATLLILAADDRFPYAQDQPNDRPIYSRVNFERVNELRTAELRKNAQQAVPNYYRFNQALADRIKAECLDLLAAAKAAESFEAFTGTNAKRWDLNAAAFDKLKASAEDTGSALFKHAVDDLAARLPGECLIDKPEPDREIRSTASDVMIDRGDARFVAIGKERLTYAANPDHIKALAKSVVGKGFPPETRPALQAIVERQIARGGPNNNRQPVYVFDRETTRQRIAEAGGSNLVARDAYAPGDLLVRAGVLDGEEVDLLQSEHKAYLRACHHDPNDPQHPEYRDLQRQRRNHQLGLAGLVLLITVGVSVYSIRYQSKVVKHPARTVAFALLMLGCLGVTQLFGVSASPYWTITPITIAASILTIAYAQRFAIGATALLALLIATATGGSISLFLVHLTVACVVSLLLSDIRTRLKMVEVGVLSALAAGVSAALVGFSRGLPSALVFTDALWALVAALAGVSVILILLPLIERTFRIATSLTLLEWADTASPLLKQLIQKAPGTWQHSHLLGSMAESAAEEIGVNGLLVRVGAYYHDIGKMLKPQYFVENQRANMNAHDGLAPTMSLLVILAHVKDGLALAREYGLPPVLHQFIAEHHGTTVVRYFHNMAAQRAEEEDEDREVSETEFRYGGPKPRTRESAILMLCDGVEGAVRALAEPTPGRIEAVVHDIVMARLLDGQLDDCEFTLRELSRVEQSLVRSLCAIHHGRIAYPRAPEKERKPTTSIRSA